MHTVLHLEPHLQDLVPIQPVVNTLLTVNAAGDVRMPRSGHSVVAYRKYMFLFGGLDFIEEAVFNDLYIKTCKFISTKCVAFG